MSVVLYIFCSTESLMTFCVRLLASSPLYHPKAKDEKLNNLRSEVIENINILNTIISCVNFVCCYYYYYYYYCIRAVKSINWV